MTIVFKGGIIRPINPCGFFKMIEKIKTFFKEVIMESKKVDWPSRRDTFVYTAIVLGISGFVALFLGALDYVFVKLLGVVIF